MLVTQEGNRYFWCFCCFLSKTGWEDTSSAAICFGYNRKGHRACDNTAIKETEPRVHIPDNTPKFRAMLSHNFKKILNDSKRPCASEISYLSRRLPSHATQCASSRTFISYV